MTCTWIRLRPCLTVASGDAWPVPSNRSDSSHDGNPAEAHQRCQAGSAATASTTWCRNNAYAWGGSGNPDPNDRSSHLGASAAPASAVPASASPQAAVLLPVS